MTFDLGAKVTQNVAQYPSNHVTYSTTKFGVANSNKIAAREEVLEKIVQRVYRQRNNAIKDIQQQQHSNCLNSIFYVFHIDFRR